MIRLNRTILHNLDRRKWHALQIGPTWPTPVIPTLSLVASRLLLGVGGKLLVHPLIGSKINGGKAVSRAREYPIAKRGTGSGTDIVGVAPLDAEGAELAIAQFDGTLQTLKLDGQLQHVRRWQHPEGQNIHTLAASTDIMLTSTSTGLMSLFRTTSETPMETFDLPTATRAWSSLITPSSLMVGVHGGILSYTLSPSGVSPLSRKLLGPDRPSRSSPYDLVTPPTGSIHSPSILLSAWYDSHLRIHDLRAPANLPQVEFADPWQWADGSAMYCATYLAEHHIAGGGSRHGTVSLFDVRNPKSGWSIFTPGGKGSPVYALQGEGGRLWGVTERRAFALSFDGTGGVEEALVAREARAPKSGVKHTPSGWKGRGGKWRWTVRYDEPGDSCTGYNHSERGVSLFDSLVAA